MRTILICPYTQTISEVDHNGDYRQIYDLLSYDDIRVNVFDAVNIGERNAIFVDDEGLFKPQSQQKFFWYFGIDAPLAGRGLIIACDRKGESKETKLPISEVQKNVRWPTITFSHIEHDEPIERKIIPGIGKSNEFTFKAVFNNYETETETGDDDGNDKS